MSFEKLSLTYFYLPILKDLAKETSKAKSKVTVLFSRSLYYHDEAPDSGYGERGLKFLRDGNWGRNNRGIDVTCHTETGNREQRSLISDPANEAN